MIDYRRYQHDAYLRRYLEALLQAGAQVDVLCLRHPDYPTPAQRPNLRIFTIPATRSHGSFLSYLFGYSTAFLLFTAWLLVLYIRNPYHVIHIHNMPDFLIFTALIPRMLGAKLILDIRDPMPEFYRSKFKLRARSLTMHCLQMQERLSAAAAHAVVTPNANFKHNLISRHIPEDKITLLPYRPDPHLFNRRNVKKDKTNHPGSFTLIYPGTIAPRYGLDVAIRALPLLKASIPQIRLVIIGPQTTYSAQLADLAEELGVSAQVDLQPAIALNKIPQQIAQANVGIYPAYPDAHMSIATPMKVLEYITMGIPVIAARLKGLEERLDNRAVMFFEPGDVEQFSDCVTELANSPARRAQLVQNADELLLQHDQKDNSHQSYLALLNHLLGPEVGESLGKIEQENRVGRVP